MAAFTASDASEGAVCGLGGLLPVATTVTDTTMARETSQPKMKAAPFLTPRLEGRMTKKAVSGSGSSVIAKPMTIRVKTTADLNVRRRPDRCIWRGGHPGLHLSAPSDLPDRLRQGHRRGG